MTMKTRPGCPQRKERQRKRLSADIGTFALGWLRITSSGTFSGSKVGQAPKWISLNSCRHNLHTVADGLRSLRLSSLMTLMSNVISALRARPPRTLQELFPRKRGWISKVPKHSQKQNSEGRNSAEVSKRDLLRSFFSFYISSITERQLHCQEDVQIELRQADSSSFDFING